MLFTRNISQNKNSCVFRTAKQHYKFPGKYKLTLKNVCIRALVCSKAQGMVFKLYFTSDGMVVVGKVKLDIFVYCFWKFWLLFFRICLTDRLLVLKKRQILVLFSLLYHHHHYYNKYIFVNHSQSSSVSNLSTQSTHVRLIE